MEKALGMFLSVLANMFFFFSAEAQPDRGHFYTSSDNTRIYFETAGEGYPVILIHGFMNTGENMKQNKVFEALLEEGYKVIVPDMRGNGRSDKPHTEEAYANDAEAKDIIGIATSLGLEHYYVLGYSRGAIIAARLLLLDKRVEKAVMGGMGADFTNPEWPRRIMFYRALSGDTVKELAPLIEHVKEAGLDQRALALQQKYQPSTSKEDLSKLEQPVLVISGMQDSDNGSASELVKLFIHGQYVQVPGDHGAAQKTKAFSDAVLKFFKE